MLFFNLCLSSGMHLLAGKIMVLDSFILGSYASTIIIFNDLDLLCENMVGVLQRMVSLSHGNGHVDLKILWVRLNSSWVQIFFF